jgi:hypothetical protein|tara:strand:+ start:3531 stop:3839 length:309 start_codon:yes stop_codon:yes gene_type:complete
MSNVRFLDNVAVTSYASSNQLVGSTFPRVVFPGEIKTVPTNQNSYAFEVFNKGIINITAGQAVLVGGETVYSHGLLRMESKFVNEGKININGILEIGDIFTI